MELFTTAEVVDLAGVGYRRLLQMLEEGWFTPAFTRGRERKTWLFDNGDIWLLRTFVRHRGVFPTREWESLVKAIDRARRDELTKAYIAKVSRTPKKASVEAIGPDEIEPLVREGTLSLLVAIDARKQEAA